LLLTSVFAITFLAVFLFDSDEDLSDEDEEDDYCFLSFFFVTTLLDRDLAGFFLPHDFSVEQLLDSTVSLLIGFAAATFPLVMTTTALEGLLISSSSLSESELSSSFTTALVI
jgi:hypothetical protein